MSFENAPLLKMIQVLEEKAPEAALDFKMLLALSEELDANNDPFDPAAQLRLNDLALRAYCTVIERTVKAGVAAGLKSDPAMLGFLLGLRLGHRVAYEQIGRTA